MYKLRKRLFLWVSKVLGFASVYKDAQAARNLRSLMSSDSYYVGSHNDVSKLFYRYSNVLNIINDDGITTVARIPPHEFFKLLESEENKKIVTMIDKVPMRMNPARGRGRGNSSRNRNRSNR